MWVRKDLQFVYICKNYTCMKGNSQLSVKKLFKNLSVMDIARDKFFSFNPIISYCFNMKRSENTGG